MLILTRRINESIIINNDITVVLLGIQGYQARIGIDAPKEISIHREEIQKKILQEKYNNGTAFEIDDMDLENEEHQERHERVELSRREHDYLPRD